jgi:hypothetical protein
MWHLKSPKIKQQKICLRAEVVFMSPSKAVLESVLHRVQMGEDTSAVMSASMA